MRRNLPSLGSYMIILIGSLFGVIYNFLVTSVFYLWFTFLFDNEIIVESATQKFIIAVSGALIGALCMSLVVSREGARKALDLAISFFMKNIVVPLIVFGAIFGATILAFAPFFNFLFIILVLMILFGDNFDSDSNVEGEGIVLFPIIVIMVFYSICVLTPFFRGLKKFYNYVTGIEYEKSSGVEAFFRRLFKQSDARKEERLEDKRVARNKGAALECLKFLFITLVLFVIVHSGLVQFSYNSVAVFWSDLWFYVFYGIAYFVPTFFAYYNKASRRSWLFVVNILAGWTVIGWFVCFAWAFFSHREVGGSQEQQHGFLYRWFFLQNPEDMKEWKKAMKEFIDAKHEATNDDDGDNGDGDNDDDDDDDD